MHVIVWRFRVSPERRGAFESAYGSSGAWAELFRKQGGYLGTELLADKSDAGEYLTLDRWRSVADFDDFQVRFGEAYRALDADLEGLALEEVRIGAFDRL